MVFYVLSRKFFYYNFKNKKRTGFIASGLFFHMSINIAAIFFISWILLKIVSLTVVPKNTLSREFSDLGFALMHNTLFWLIKMTNSALYWLVRINKAISLKRQFLNQSV